MKQTDILRIGASVGVGLATGAFSLYVSVKRSAERVLLKKGAFNEINAEHSQRELKIHQSFANQNFGLIGKEEKQAMLQERKRWHKEIRQIAHQKQVDGFANAWNTLDNKTKTKCVGFSTVIGVAMGGITHLTLRGGRKGNDGWTDDVHWQGDAAHHDVFGIDGFDLGL